MSCGSAKMAQNRRATVDQWLFCFEFIVSDYLVFAVSEVFCGADCGKVGTADGS